MRGQGALEYMLIVSIFFLVLSSVTLTMIYNPARNAGLDVKGIASVRSACNEISNSINSVQGDANGSQSVEWVDLETGWSIRIENGKKSSDLIIQTSTTEGTENVKSSLYYSFSNLGTGYSTVSEISNISPGLYAIVARKGFEGNKEGLDTSHLDNNKIIIYLNTEGN